GWVMLTWCVCASATGAAHGEMEKAPPSEEDGATVLTQRGERSSQGRRPRPHHIPVSMYAVSPTSAAFQSHSSIFHTEPGTASSGRSGQKFPAISDPGCTSAYSSIEPSQASCVEYSTPSPPITLTERSSSRNPASSATRIADTVAVRATSSGGPPAAPWSLSVAGSMVSSHASSMTGEPTGSGSS